VARGADPVEKHITLDRSMTGPDHAASLDPDEFRALVLAIREAQVALGTGQKLPAAAEAETAAVARKSLHWHHALGPGATVQAEDLIALRPGTGLPPTDQVKIVGRQVVGGVLAGAMVRLEDVEPVGAA
jgi:N,N'-diacetyllegionaminate synthase